jgi:hypothetical protein
MDDQITSIKQIPYSSYFVLTNDSFMSGWGHAQDRINTLIFSCDSLSEAEIVATNARNRTDQTYIRIISGHALQHYRLRATHMYQLKDKSSYPSWYKPNYFKK